MGFITRVQKDRSAYKAERKALRGKTNVLSAQPATPRPRAKQKCGCAQVMGDPQTIQACTDTSEIRERPWEILPQLSPLHLRTVVPKAWNHCMRSMSHPGHRVGVGVLLMRISPTVGPFSQLNEETMLIRSLLAIPNHPLQIGTC